MSDRVYSYPDEVVREWKRERDELIEENKVLRAVIQNKGRQLELETLIRGHMEAMRPLLDEWSSLKTPATRGEGVSGGN